MGVTQIIERLEELREEYGNLPVWVYADHGQTPEEAYQIEVIYVNKKDSDSQVSVTDMNSEDYEVDDFVKVFLIN